ncbi:MAG: cell division protein FtsZ [SAR324 cluster bacterium]|nr:cell division protein FtsZ [SAR324 cluster bacterium]
MFDNKIDLSSNYDELSKFKPPLIKVIGVGGGGGNVVNRMIADGIVGVDYCVINTDIAVLNESSANTKLVIGKKLTKGQGAGMKPDIGRKAALEDGSDIEEYLKGGEVVFIAVGMGGGTGTGAAPVLAQMSKELGILTVGVVTTPFLFEGRKRNKIAAAGVDELRKHTDTLMIIPNDRLLEIAGNDNQVMTVIESFRMADDVLKQAISGLTMLINRTGVINLDFADVKTVMKNKGKAIIGIGSGVGEGRGLTAARRAIKSPILNEVNIKGATGAIINIVADKEFTLLDAKNTASYIESYGTEDADVMFGLVYDESKKSEVTVTVIATGFDDQLITEDVNERITVQSSFDRFNEEEQTEETDKEQDSDLAKVIHISPKQGDFSKKEALAGKTGDDENKNLDLLAGAGSEDGVGEAKIDDTNTDDRNIDDNNQEDDGNDSNNNEEVELVLSSDDLKRIERDPFIPGKLVGDKKLTEDREYPAFLRRYNKKNSDK